MRKALVVFMLCVALLVPMRQSQAILPLAPVAAFLLEVTGGSILVGDLVAGMTGVIAAVLWYECNGMKWGGQCETKPSSLPASAAPGKPGMTIKLAPDAKRNNPDPEKFDDSREAKPKSSVPAKPVGGGSPGGEAGADTFFWGNTFDGKMVTGGSAAGVLKAIASYSDCKQFTPCVYAGLTRVDYPAEKMGIVGSNAAGSTCPNYQLYTGGFEYTNGSNTWPRRVNNVNGSACVPSNISPNNAAHQVPSETQLTCPQGYTLNGTQCDLTDASQVQKPADEPCEILYYAATKTMKVDPQNPNCKDITDGQKVKQPSNDGTGNDMEITPNNEGGFDITKSNGTGKSTTVKTGPYDSQAGGYSIISTTQTTPAGQDGDDPKGMGCGIPGKPACDVAMSSDAATDAAGSSAQQGITDGHNTLKGALENIDPNKFEWSFIPQIPVASCENPRVKNPILAQYLDVDICSYFDKFSFFLNGVLGVLCLYGCVREIQKATRA